MATKVEFLQAIKNSDHGHYVEKYLAELQADESAIDSWTTEQWNHIFLDTPKDSALEALALRQMVELATDINDLIHLGQRINRRHALQVRIDERLFDMKVES